LQALKIAGRQTGRYQKISGSQLLHATQHTRHWL